MQNSRESFSAKHSAVQSAISLYSFLNDLSSLGCVSRVQLEPRSGSGALRQCILTLPFEQMLQRLSSSVLGAIKTLSYKVDS